MSSIFDLKTSTAELSSVNNGVSRMTYEQSAPTRDVTGNNFPNGAIHFRWETSGTKWWIPSRSYLRMRFTLKDPAGVALTQEAGIAPSMGLMANLFQSLEFRLNDKTISRVSDFVPQICALEERLDKSASWLRGVGNSSNFWESQFSLRQVDVTSDGSRVVSSEYKNDRVLLGYAPANTVAIANTGVLTFAAGGGAAPPDARLHWVAGDYIEIDSAAAGVGLLRYRVSAVLGAATLQINNLVAVPLVAEAADFRRVRTINHSDSARNVSTFELCWTPCLSVYKVNHALPTGKYELVLVPQSSTSYQKYAIESNVDDKAAGVDYTFSVVDMFHYTNTVEGSRCDALTYYLDLNSTTCQSEAVGTSNSFIQKNFDVSPSSYALTVAYQDNRCGVDTRLCATKFKAYNAAITTSQELKLDRFMLSYAGQNLPSPDAAVSFIPGTDFTTQRYLESLIYSGNFFDTGGSETIQEFHSRGQYLYFSVPRDGTDRSTRVAVHAGFGSANGADLANTRLLLFSHAKQVARITISDGRVTDCVLEDA